MHANRILRRYYPKPFTYPKLAEPLHQHWAQYMHNWAKDVETEAGSTVTIAAASPSTNVILLNIIIFLVSSRKWLLRLYRWGLAKGKERSVSLKTGRRPWESKSQEGTVLTRWHPVIAWRRRNDRNLSGRRPKAAPVLTGVGAALLT